MSFFRSSCVKIMPVNFIVDASASIFTFFDCDDNSGIPSP